MKFSHLGMALAMCLSLSTSAKADKGTDRLLGRYESTNRAEPIHTIRISEDKESHKINVAATAWGYPDDSNWGESHAEVYKDSVENSNRERLFAHFEVGRTKMLLIMGGVPNDNAVNLSCYSEDGATKKWFDQELYKKQ